MNRHERTFLMKLAERILKIAQTLPEGEYVAPQDFLHLGTRLEAFRVLRLLVAEGKMSRVGPGIYVPFIAWEFGNGWRLPKGHLIIQELEKKPE